MRALGSCSVPATRAGRADCGFGVRCSPELYGSVSYRPIRWLRLQGVLEGSGPASFQSKGSFRA